MIFNLQVLRGVAAMGVVFYHADYWLKGEYHTDFFGVATFFVISGFIMCFVTKDSADGFLTKRLIRIVPIYWLCLAVAFYKFHPGQHDDPFLWGWMLRSLFFVPLPEGIQPVLGVGWTLNFEIYFYFVFAAALLISRRFAPLITAAVVLGVHEANSLWPGHFLLQNYSHIYIMFFPAGIAAFYIWRYIGPVLPKWPVIVIGWALIAAMYVSQFDIYFWNQIFGVIPLPVHWGFAAPFVIVTSALLISKAGADISWKPLVLIGDASYSIYLTHTFFIESYRPYTVWFGTPKENFASLIFFMLASCLIGVVAHLFIERPLIYAVRLLVFRNTEASHARQTADMTMLSSVPKNVVVPPPASSREFI